MVSNSKQGVGPRKAEMALSQHLVSTCFAKVFCALGTSRMGRLPASRTLSRTSAKGRKQRFKLRHYRKAPAKAIAAATERPASGNAM